MCVPTTPEGKISGYCFLRLPAAQQLRVPLRTIAKFSSHKSPVPGRGVAVGSLLLLYRQVVPLWGHHWESR